MLPIVGDLASLRRLRAICEELFDPAIAAHRGRLLQFPVYKKAQPDFAKTHFE
jgi:hypothetical protein